MLYFDFVWHGLFYIEVSSTLMSCVDQDGILKYAYKGGWRSGVGKWLRLPIPVSRKIKFHFVRDLREGEIWVSFRLLVLYPFF